MLSSRHDIVDESMIREDNSNAERAAGSWLHPRHQAMRCYVCRGRIRIRGVREPDADEQARALRDRPHQPQIDAKRAEIVENSMILKPPAVCIHAPRYGSKRYLDSRSVPA